MLSFRPSWLRIGLWGLTLPLIVLNGWALLLLFGYFRTIITIVVVATLLAFVLEYPVDWLQRLNLRRQRSPAHQPISSRLTLGDRISDTVAAVMGSWPFIILQSILLAVWVGLNVVAWMRHWDPYPFILLNLMLSFQAAYAAPIIMMSQNRQAAIDRHNAQHDYEVNMKAELEIELLQDKMNLLRGEELVTLLEMLKEQQQQLQRLEALLQEQHSNINPEAGGH